MNEETDNTDEKDDCYIEAQQLYNKFKIWHKKYNPGTVIPIYKIFTTGLRGHFDLQKKGRAWRLSVINVKYKENNDE